MQFNPGLVQSDGGILQGNAQIFPVKFSNPVSRLDTASIRHFEISYNAISIELESCATGSRHLAVGNNLPVEISQPQSIHPYLIDFRRIHLFTLTQAFPLSSSTGAKDAQNCGNIQKVPHIHYFTEPRSSSSSSLRSSPAMKS